MRILPSIWVKSPVAVVCGGSMMYIDALTKGIDDIPTVSDGVRQYVKDMHAAHGLGAVLAQLEILDPTFHATVDKANPIRRFSRASAAAVPSRFLKQLSAGRGRSFSHE